ncbi:hypothetical protein K2173_016922 [Erythroxylum novogranatense]|uniref:SUF system FeS cluster assembly SufBD core domain-containing protein n=1 Tax=Erythroxylum novogranatense TaxID=1862640 RepID=A0AAV8U587_9ROSI|nr:hypothetical protein K2173_016922 [Erythroxylum novogranatense]
MEIVRETLSNEKHSDMNSYHDMPNLGILFVALKIGQDTESTYEFVEYAQCMMQMLTRSLLLEPRATINVKPNLQIIVDDVKCSHGAAISDLEESQLFYFQARGIDPETARRALVFSFGVEVIERLHHSLVRKDVEGHVKGLLGWSSRHK